MNQLTLKSIPQGIQNQGASGSKTKDPKPRNQRIQNQGARWASGCWLASPSAAGRLRLLPRQLRACRLHPPFWGCEERSGGCGGMVGGGGAGGGAALGILLAFLWPLLASLCYTVISCPVVWILMSFGSMLQALLSFSVPCYRF